MKTTPKGTGSICLTYEKDFVEQQQEKPKESTNIIFKDLKVKQEKKVHWSEDTVNNENMGLKKSKSNTLLTYFYFLKIFYLIVCCIYKKPRLNPDDTSSESCSSCDEKGKNAYERPNHYDRKKKV